MRTFAAGALAAALTATALGCGHAPPPAAPTPKALAASAAPAAPPRLEGAEDAAPARDAPGLWVSVPAPARSLARLRTLLRNSPRLGALLDGVLTRVAGFDLEQPVFAVSDGSAHVFSVGLGRELADELKSATSSPDCAVLELRGRSRLACGSAARPTDDEARREAPRATTSDVHVELDGALAQRLAKTRRPTPDGNDDAALAQGRRFGERALADLVGMSLDLTLEGTPELRLSYRTRGHGAVSAWASTPAAAPPPAFFRLPADAEAALFGSAPPAADQAELKKAVLDAVTAEGAASECAAAAAGQRAELEKLLFTGGSFVGALGLDRPRAEAAAEALTQAPADKRRLLLARDAFKGWLLVGLEEPAARWADGLVALLAHDCTRKGSAKRLVTVTRKLAPRLGLPAGTLELATVTGATRDKPASRSVVLVAPDKERTWVSVAHDEATAAARLKAVLSGTSQLAARPGLLALRAPAAAGAFITASGASWLGGDESTDAGVLERAKKLLAARALSTGGRTPIVLRMTTSRDAAGPDAEASVSVSVSVALDAAAIGDAATLLF